jgi:hypothetical protein
LANELTDAGRICLRAGRGTCADGLVWQRQDLKEEAVKGDEVLLDEDVSGFDVGIGGEV